MIELEYKVVRSLRRKKLTITVERDRAIIVHAPEERLKNRCIGSWMRNANGY